MRTNLKKLLGVPTGLLLLGGGLLAGGCGEARGGSEGADARLAAMAAPGGRIQGSRPGEGGEVPGGTEAGWVGTGQTPEDSGREAPVGGGLREGGGEAQGVDAGRTTALVRAATRVAPAVVGVAVLRQERIRPMSLWDEFFLPPGAYRRAAGYGSGVIFDPRGYILTNDHVVRGADRIRVTLPDGRDFPARLVGSDGLTDLAVLKVEGTNLPVAPMGTSRNLLIGEWSVAIGNPFAYLLSNTEPTVTAGVISAVGRHIIPSGEDQGFYLGMIQTDASINPGNSGGPLVNALGEVIGINASIFSRSGGSEGLGFAIPIDRALRVADDLIRHGEVRRAWTGLEVEAVEADEWGRMRGVRVASVVPGSPAAASGLSPGARLLRANGRALATPLDFEAVLLDLRAGEAVELEVEGRGRPVRLVTETLPTARAQRVEVLKDLEVITLTPQIRAERGIRAESGVLITGISTELSASLGLRVGDVLLQINNTRIRNAEDAARAIREIGGGMRVRLYFERNGVQYFREFFTRR